MTIQETLAKHNINIDFEAMKNHVDEILQKEGEFKTGHKLKKKNKIILVLVICVMMTFAWEMFMLIQEEINTSFQNPDMLLSIFSYQIHPFLIYTGLGILGIITITIIITIKYKKIPYILTKETIKIIKNDQLIFFKDIENLEISFRQITIRGASSDLLSRLIPHMILDMQLKMNPPKLIFKNRTTEDYSIFEKAPNYNKTEDLTLKAIIWILQKFEKDKKFKYKISDQYDYLADQMKKITIQFNKIK